MIILFPSEPFSPKEIDSSFIAEYEAAKLAGFEVFLFDHDEMVKSGHFITNIPYNHGATEKVILRSWMLKYEIYACLSVSLIEQNYELFNGLDGYANCHYFPNAFPIIKEYTSNAWWTFDWEYTMCNTDRINWQPIRDYLGGDVLIKDYVKSEKGNSELFILKKDLKNHEFYGRILKFIEARGNLFNKGLVFKEVVELKKYDGQTNEWRMYFLKNQLLVCDRNSEAPLYSMAPYKDMIDGFSDLAKKIKSDFFTMDIAETEHGTWMILELGDGQVSGLPLKTDALGFYNKMNMLLNKIKV